MSSDWFLSPRRDVVALFASGFCLLAGCGGDGLSRHAVSGTIKFEGRPLEMGSVAFEPDLSAGKMAPSSYAKVENGAFKIPAEEGPIKGKYNLRVVSFDKSKIKLDVPPGTPINMPALYPPHTLSVDIPPPNGVLELDLTPTKAGGSK